MNILHTEQLELVPAPAEFIRLLATGEYERASCLLNVFVPVGWPDDDAARAGLHMHLQAMQENALELLWRIRLIVLRESREVIGSINLKGLPRQNGDVEIGWGVSAEHRRQGIAVEAAGAVVAWVFSQAGVKRVIATIPEDNVASMRVAERLGMSLTQERKHDLPMWVLRKSD